MWPLVVMIAGVLAAAGALALWVRYQARKDRERKA